MSDSGLRGVAGRYGFRRVERVSIRRNDGGVAAYVTGIAHRYPHEVRVPMSVAAQFVTAGMPLTIDMPGAVPASPSANAADI